MHGAITAMDYYNLDSFSIFTYNRPETEILADGRTVLIMPVWKWLVA